MWTKLINNKKSSDLGHHHFWQPISVSLHLHHPCKLIADWHPYIIHQDGFVEPEVGFKRLNQKQLITSYNSLVPTFVFAEKSSGTFET